MHTYRCVFILVIKITLFNASCELTFYRLIVQVLVMDKYMYAYPGPGYFIGLCNCYDFRGVFYICICAEHIEPAHLPWPPLDVLSSPPWITPMCSYL